MSSRWKYESSGIPDEEFIRGKVPMTKEEVRSIAVGKLRISRKDTVVDVGAGTGSISIEAALKAKKGLVYAIEKNGEGVDLIERNIKNFSIDNIKVMQGNAEEILGDIEFADSIFVGGSGGKLKEIIRLCDNLLAEDGRIVLNFITIENLHNSLTELKILGFKNIDVVSVNIARSANIGTMTMMKSENPIYIVSADKR